MTMLVTSAAPNVIASTVPSIDTSARRGMSPGIERAKQTHDSRTRSPARPPRRRDPGARDSATAVCTTRPRVAPSAERIARSRIRPVDRASSMFARFTQAMSSRKPTAAMSTHSARRRRVARHPAFGRLDRHAHALCVGVLTRELARDTIEVRLRGIDRHARRETSYRRELEAVTVLVRAAR